MTEMPSYTQSEQQNRDTFLALMWSLSYPGRVHSLPETTLDPWELVAFTLLDLETSYYTPDEHLNARLASTGARALSADRAAYHFYPELTSLEMIKIASVGNMMFPDEAATLFVGGNLSEGLTYQLTGPGIDATQSVQIDDIPVTLWDLRVKTLHYPLGWDVFVIDTTSKPARVIGLPRTTKIDPE